MIITYLIKNKIVAIKRLKVAQLKGSLKTRHATMKFIMEFIMEQMKAAYINDVASIIMVKRLVKNKIVPLTFNDGYELEDCVFQLFHRV